MAVVTRYYAERPTDLLNFLSSVPPEALREGGVLEVTEPDGTVTTMTLGKAEPVEDDFAARFRIV